MTNTTITVRVSSELRDKLDKIAKATRRSKSFLANEAIERYVEVEWEIIEGVLEGLEDVKAGRVVPHEDVMREGREIIERASTAKQAAE